MPFNYKEYKDSFGEYLKEKRLALKLKQTEVAALLGVSRDCIKNWESGEYSVTTRFRPRVIDFIGICPCNPYLSLELKLRQCRTNCGLARPLVACILGLSDYELKAIEQEKIKSKKEIDQLILEFLRGKIIPFEEIRERFPNKGFK